MITPSIANQLLLRLALLPAPFIIGAGVWVELSTWGGVVATALTALLSIPYLREVHQYRQAVREDERGAAAFAEFNAAANERSRIRHRRYLDSLTH